MIADVSRFIIPLCLYLNLLETFDKIAPLQDRPKYLGGTVCGVFHF